MDEELSTTVSVPLDGDGFLRRECPTCEREFKWFASSDADPGESEVPDGGYHCPYCVVQAPGDAWFTKPQLELAEATVSREFVDPMLKDFKRDVERSSGGFLDISVGFEESDDPEPLAESDDMRRVVFDCHPAEPVKVLDDWRDAVHCLICGKPAAAS